MAEELLCLDPFAPVGGRREAAADGACCFWDATPGWGAGSGWLLVHGFGGDGADFEAWAAACPSLPERRAISLPDHGPAMRPSEGWEDFPAAVWAALPAMRRPLLIGYSMGARVALAAALQVQEALSGLVLISGSAGLRTEAERAQRGEDDAAWAALLRSRGMAAFEARWQAQPVIASRAQIPAPWRERWLTRRLHQSAGALACALEHGGTGAMPDLWPALHALELPVHLVVGEEDTKFRVVAAALDAALPHSHVDVVQGAGHACHVEAPEAFVRLMLRRWAPAEEGWVWTRA